MSKCIDCAYFLDCKKANEYMTCNKFKFIRKEIKYEDKRDNRENKKRD